MSSPGGMHMTVSCVCSPRVPFVRNLGLGPLLRDIRLRLELSQLLVGRGAACFAHGGRIAAQLVDLPLDRGLRLCGADLRLCLQLVDAATDVRQPLIHRRRGRAHHDLLS
jgi:hypothetical protein